MKLTYTLTLDDYKAAQVLHRRQTFGRRTTWFFLLRVMPGIGLLVLAWALFTGLTHKAGFSQNPPVTLVVPIIFLLLPLINHNLVRKQFNQLFPPTARNLSIDIDEERIICTNPGVSDSRLLWNAIIEFAQDERITMLYISKLRFLFFPTQVISPSQRAELNDLVARHVNRRS
jgi:hypothetical protein